MLYAVTYEIFGISSSGGSASTSRDEIIEFAKSWAKIGIDQLDDAVAFTEWVDLNGEEKDPISLLNSSDIDEVENIVIQISDEMKTNNVGYVDIWKYEDIFQLIAEQRVESWCSSHLQNRFAAVRKDYFRLMQELTEEWSNS